MRAFLVFTCETEANRQTEKEPNERLLIQTVEQFKQFTCMSWADGNGVENQITKEKYNSKSNSCAGQLNGMVHRTAATPPQLRLQAREEERERVATAAAD